MEKFREFLGIQFEKGDKLPFTDIFQLLSAPSKLASKSSRIFGIIGCFIYKFKIIIYLHELLIELDHAHKLYVDMNCLVNGPATNLHE